MSFKSFLSNNSSELFTGFAISGMIWSVVLGAKATPRAMKRIEKRKKELGVEQLGVVETVKTAGPCYIPTAIVMGLTGYFIVKPVRDEMNKNSLLATSLMISEEARHAFEEKTKEIIGEKKTNEIKDKVAEDKYKESNASTNKKPGYLHFMDTLLNCEFYLKTSKELDLLEKDMELDIVNYNFVSINEWLDRLQLPSVDASIGNLGWGPGNGFSLHRTWTEDANGEPICLITHTTDPLPRKQAEGCWGA